MPRVSKFLEAVWGVVSRRCCASTSDVMAELVLNHSTAYYVLKRLHKSGAVERHMLGGVAYWCVPGRKPADCRVKLYQLLVKGLCQMLNGAKGGVATVSVAELLSVAGHETNAPLILAAAVRLFETLQLHMKKKKKKNSVYFVVDVAKARRFCLSSNAP